MSAKAMGVYAVVLIAFCGFKILASGWSIDPDYSIRFSGSRAEGTFSGLRGTIRYDPDDLENSFIDVVVDAKTIKTGNATKDGHARGEGWFDVKRYPTIRFVSTAFASSVEGNVVTGMLDLHGVKREVAIPFTFSTTGTKGTFAGKFSVNRKDYGIDGNFAGFLVGDEFDITLRVPVSRARE